MHKFVIFLVVVAAAAFGGIWLFTSGPLGQRLGLAGPAQSTPTPAASPTPILQYQTAAPPAAVPTAESSPTAAAGTTQEHSTVFVGNSNLEDLYLYGLIPNADYFFKIGLTVSSAFDTPTAEGTVPVIEELQGKDYSQILLMFGNNELGWGSVDTFTDQYRKLIEQVRAYEPNASIHLMSILPVSEAVSGEGKDGATKENIDRFNEAIRTLANEMNCYYMDGDPVLRNENGYLPPDAAADGVHLNKDYTARWADVIIDEIGGDVASEPSA